MTAPKKTTIKAPQDHKPKATAQTEAQEQEAFTVHLLDRDWTIARDALDDFELLSELATIDGGGTNAVMAMASALPRVLGRAQTAEAMALLRDENGRVSIEKGAKFFADVFGALNPNS